MQTRIALRRLSGNNPSEIAIRDPRALAKFSAMAEERNAAIEERKNRPQMSQAHLAAAQAKIEAEREGSINLELPVIDRFTAYTFTKNSAYNSRDPGLKTLAFQLKSLWEADPTGYLSTGQILSLKAHYQKGYGKTAAVDVLINKLPRVGFVELNVSSLQKIASKIVTQADFDEACRMNGLTGNRPDQVRSRQYILAMVKSAAGEEQTDSPMEVDVNQQQPDQLSGIDAGSGAEVLKGEPSVGQPRATEKAAADEYSGEARNDTERWQDLPYYECERLLREVGISDYTVDGLTVEDLSRKSWRGIPAYIRDKLKPKINKSASKLPTEAQIVSAVLDANTVKIAGWQIRVNDHDLVELTSPNGGQRTARLSTLEATVKDFRRLVAQTSPNYDPKVNAQQPDYVSVGGGDAELGEDSGTGEGFDDPKVNKSNPAKDQPGTSNSVVGRRTAAHRLVAQLTPPQWVAQPNVWKWAVKIVEKTGTPLYPVVVAHYKNKCNELKLVSKVAGGAETLGPDSLLEPGFKVPKLSPQDVSKPGSQPGTSLPNKGDAEEPDHEGDGVPWENVKPNPKLSRKAQNLQPMEAEMSETAGGPGSGRKKQPGSGTQQPPKSPAPAPQQPAPPGGGGTYDNHPAMQYKNVQSHVPKLQGGVEQGWDTLDPVEKQKAITDVYALDLSWQSQADDVASDKYEEGPDSVNNALNELQNGSMGYANTPELEHSNKSWGQLPPDIQEGLKRYHGTGLPPQQPAPAPGPVGRNGPEKPKESDKHDDIENLEDQAINQLQTTQNLEKEVSASLIDSFIESSDPAERYRRARANRPTAAMLEGIGDENGWLATRAAKLLTAEEEEVRADLDQEGEGEVREDGKLAYTFKYDSKLDEPSTRDIQAYINAQTGGQHFVVEASTVSDGYAFALIREASDEDDDDKAHEAKRQAVRAALGKSSQMAVNPVPSAQEDNAGGEHNAQEDTAGLNPCPSCGQFDYVEIPGTDQRSCNSCGTVFTSNYADDLDAQLDPGQNPAGMGADYNGTILNHEGQQGEVPPETGFCFGCGQPGKMKEEACSSCGYSEMKPEAQTVDETPYSQEELDPKSAPQSNLPWEYTDEDLQPMQEQAMVAQPKAGKKSAAKLSEEWGDGGTFGRSVEAEDERSLHQLHRYLNGQEPDWSHLQNAPAQPGTPAGGMPDQPGQPGQPMQEEAQAESQMQLPNAPQNPGAKPVPDQVAPPTDEPDEMVGQKQYLDQNVIAALYPVQKKSLWYNEGMTKKSQMLDQAEMHETAGGPGSGRKKGPGSSQPSEQPKSKPANEGVDPNEAAQAHSEGGEAGRSFFQKHFPVGSSVAHPDFGTGTVADHKQSGPIINWSGNGEGKGHTTHDFGSNSSPEDMVNEMGQYQVGAPGTKLRKPRQKWPPPGYNPATGWQTGPYAQPSPTPPPTSQPPESGYGSPENPKPGYTPQDYENRAIFERNKPKG